MTYFSVTTSTNTKEDETRYRFKTNMKVYTTDSHLIPTASPVIITC